MGNHKDFNEYIAENLRDTREEVREFKLDINKRMDGMERRMDRFEDKMESLRTEIRAATDTSQKEISASSRHSQVLTGTMVAAIFGFLYTVFK